MITQNLSFGDFIKQRRLTLMSQRDMAMRLGVSFSYASDIENGRRNPPGDDLLVQIAELLNLKGIDRDDYFDLAGKWRNEVSPDLYDYIMNQEVSPAVRLALRTARDFGATKQDWQEFIESIN